MRSFLFHLGHEPAQELATPSLPLHSRLQHEFVIQKMNTPFGYALATGMAMGAAALIGQYGWQAAIWLMFALMVLPLILLTIFQVRFGLFVILATSFLVMLVKRVAPGLPSMALIDFLLLSMMFGVFLQQVSQRNWSFAKGGITIGIAIWMGYNVFQLANPWLPSSLGWLYSIRSSAGYMLLYVVALFSLSKWRHIRALANFWLVMSTLAAVYGLFQEAAGLPAFEKNWVLSDLTRFQEVYEEGHARTFSFFASPATFGMVMAVSTVMSLSLLFEKQQSSVRRLLLLISSGLMITAMLFSGTRTAFVILPVGFGLVALLTMRRDIWLIGLGGIALWLALLFSPIDHPTIQRLQASFTPNSAGSFQIRMENQDFAQSVIQNYPIGVGLGTTGERGQLFSPHTLLSQFPSKSGYVMIAIETGWIGLFLFICLVGLVLLTAVRNYFRTQGHDPRLYVATFAGILLALAIANYTQRALFQPPTNLMFYLAMAVVVRLQQLAPAPQIE